MINKQEPRKTLAHCSCTEMKINQFHVYIPGVWSEMHRQLPRCVVIGVLRPNDIRGNCCLILFLLECQSLNPLQEGGASTTRTPSVQELIMMVFTSLLLRNANYH